ncbi:glycosyltransferase [uncultured Chryseobacterium sp.]|uniref:glycosyltransferase n=1 Tax=uncultured Chryseobacterium sp. TaxID=259322 RepID=UPI00258DF6BB|nr:glycosyltransferase [uncultured Chryseobacterium sp.]
MSTKKRILFRFSTAGPDAQELINILKNIDYNKFEVSLILDYHDRNFFKKVPKGIKVFSLAKGCGEMSKFSVIYFFQRLYARFTNLFCQYYQFPIKKKISQNPDIEVAFGPSALKSLLKSPFTDSKKVIWLLRDVREDYTLEYGKKLARMVSHCTITVFSSLYAQQAFENYFEIELPRSAYIHPYINGEDVLKKSLQKIPGTIDLFCEIQKFFISVGDLTYQKGYDSLIVAHAELLEEGFDHKVMVIGDGAEYGKLRDMIKYLGLEDSFFLLGEQDNPYCFIQSADYYIQPSRCESYPVILREVVVLNKPIISTDVGSVGELLGQWKTAYLIQFNVTEIKEMMKEFLYNKSLVTSIMDEQKSFNFLTCNKIICDQITDLFSNL